jgi:hypothetical protein
MTVPIPVVAGLALAALLGKSGGKKSSSKSYKKIPSEFGTKAEPNRDAAKEFILSASNNLTNKYGIMENLGEYLSGVAYLESRFNPFVINGNSRNSARGLFQMRADSAFSDSNGLKKYRNTPDVLFDPRVSFVAAVDYAYRGAKRSYEKGGSPDWYAIRRWWALPYLIHDYALENERSRSTRESLNGALRNLGMSTSKLSKKINIKNYPGAIKIGQDLGILNSKGEIT